MPRRGYPQALRTWKKRYAMHLDIVGGLDTTIEEIRMIKNASGVDVCIKNVRIALKEVGLESTKKVFLPTLSTKNGKEILEFTKIQKD